jgi:hypothetical protein
MRRLHELVKPGTKVAALIPSVMVNAAAPGPVRGAARRAIATGYGLGSTEFGPRWAGHCSAIAHVPDRTRENPASKAAIARSSRIDDKPGRPV